MTKAMLSFAINMQIIDLEYDPISRMRSKFTTGILIIQLLSILLFFFPKAIMTRIPLSINLTCMAVIIIFNFATNAVLKQSRKKGKEIQKLVDILASCDGCEECEITEEDCGCKCEPKKEETKNDDRANVE